MSLISLFDRCYPNVSGGILVLVSFVFCLYVYTQCQLPRYVTENWFDYFKLSMAKTELTISDYKSALQLIFLGSFTGSFIQFAI